MSNPVKNSEIEDVLSSIRRLVSESHGQPSVPSAALNPKSPPSSGATKVTSSGQAKDAGLSSGTDRHAGKKLVLAPSQRIQKDTEAPNGEPTSPVADSPFVAELKEDLAPLRESLPNFLQKRVAPEKDVAEPEATNASKVGSDDQSDDPDRQMNDSVTDQVGQEDVAQLEAITPLEEVKNTLPFPAPESLTFETARRETTGGKEADGLSPSFKAPRRPWEIEGERLSGWQGVRTPEPESFEPDGPEDGENAALPGAAINWEDHEPEASDTSANPELDLDLDATAQAADGAADEMPSEPQTEPSETSVADQMTAQVSEDIATEVAASEETIDAQQYEAVLDEEMLRDLVGEIVRQELQGPLGERITRNVRKLVRREINRAMTARSFNDT